MKRTVVYVAAERYGIQARVIPLNHTSELVQNGAWAITSRVLSWDESTGRIETLNTVYVPAKADESSQEVAAQGVAA